MKKQIQVNLLGEIINIESFHKLSNNYIKLLEVFVNNHTCKFNVDVLCKYFLKNNIMSRITILRFLKDSISYGYIKEMKVTKVTSGKQGYRPITKYFFDDNTEPSDYDKRKKYYSVTSIGFNIWEKNKNIMCI